MVVGLISGAAHQLSHLSADLRGGLNISSPEHSMSGAAGIGGIAARARALTGPRRAASGAAQRSRWGTPGEVFMAATGLEHVRLVMASSTAHRLTAFLKHALVQYCQLPRPPS